jgi:hypothetical protein
MRTYQQDYAGWAEDTAKAIEEGRWDEIDRGALVEEVESLAGRDRREIKSRLQVLLMHLLKMKYRPDKETRGWRNTVLLQREEIHTVLAESPSLQPLMAELLARAYPVARAMASNETGLPLETFPPSCEWSLKDIRSEKEA